MANKAEMKVEIDKLKEENEELKTKVEELNNKISELPTIEEFTELKESSTGEKPKGPEKTVKLIWPYNVAPYAGGTPSIFGYNLDSEDETLFAMVPKSRVKVETGRKGKRFVTEKEFSEMKGSEKE